MNTNNDDGAPRFDPEQEWRTVNVCIKAIDATIEANGGVMVSTCLLNLHFVSVREAIREHYCDEYTVLFGNDDDPDAPCVTLWLKGGMDQLITTSETVEGENNEACESTLVEAKARAAHA